MNTDLQRAGLKGQHGLPLASIAIIQRSVLQARHTRRRPGPVPWVPGIDLGQQIAERYAPSSNAAQPSRIQINANGHGRLANVLTSFIGSPGKVGLTRRTYS